eukprot:2913130-Amphidinium_carterae.1
MDTADHRLELQLNYIDAIPAYPVAEQYLARVPSDLLDQVLFLLRMPSRGIATYSVALLILIILRGQLEPTAEAQSGTAFTLSLIHI